MKTGASFFTSSARRRRGGLLVTALLLCSIISMIVLPSYLLLSKSVLQMSHRGFYSVAVVDLSESGIEHAIWAQKLSFSDPATAWSGWSQNADGTYYRKLPSFNYGGGVVGTVNVAVTTPVGANPIALTKASITLQDGSQVEKWLRVTYSGAVPNEKITWGKLGIDTPKYIIESDASIVAPLVFAIVLGQ